MKFSLSLAQALALLMSVGFITYVCVIVVPLVRHKRRGLGVADTFRWHVFIPARDEEAVIGQTVEYTRRQFPEADVWVVDDASQDRTAAIVIELADRDDHVHLVSRTLPDARTGKGEALNAAFRALQSALTAETDRSRVVIVVIDADGRLAPNCLAVCAADHLFGDERVGSVQIGVRMLNCDQRTPFPTRGRLANVFGRTLVRMQDLEFRAPITAIQLTRRYTRSVGLGGNGQFTRLEALEAIDQGDQRPWRGALLEDYELSLHLLMAGYVNEFTADTFVDQEGLPGLGSLITQRTRWGQGTMQCSVYLPRLWASRNVSTIGALEASYYLLQPWMQLVGTIVYPLPFVVLSVFALRDPSGFSSWWTSEGWILLMLYTAIGLIPFVIWGPVYARLPRRGPKMSLGRGMAYGFAYSVFIFSFYVTSWRAFLRVVRGRRDWVKTRRNSEANRRPIDPPVAISPQPLLQPVTANSWSGGLSHTTASPKQALFEDLCRAYTAFAFDMEYVGAVEDPTETPFPISPPVHRDGRVLVGV